MIKLTTSHLCWAIIAMSCRYIMRIFQYFSKVYSYVLNSKLMMAFNMTGINMIDLFWDIGQISNLKTEIILDMFLDYSRVKLELY